MARQAALIPILVKQIVLRCGLLFVGKAILLGNLYAETAEAAFQLGAASGMV